MLAGVLGLTSVQARELTVGVLAPEGGNRADSAWESTRAHLVSALRQDVEFKPFDIAGLRSAVATGALDFVILNSGLYVELESAHGASRIATLESPQAHSATQAIAATIVARADRQDLGGLHDLRGLRVAATGPDAFGGWQVALGPLNQAGVDADKDLKLEFVGYPMQAVVQRVLDSRADAGIVRNCLIESMVRRGELAADALKVLNAQTGAAERCARSSGLYPDWPFATLRNTPVELARQVALALLAMPADADGVRWAVPTDYQAVHELFRELRIGPYAYLREPSVGHLVRRWWWAFALAALGFGGGALHILRAEWLVRTRTRELRQVLAERERLSREAREQQDKLDHLARLGTLGEISSMLAHELAQPLTSIGNFARGIVRRLQAGRLDTPPIQAAAAEIASEAERAAGILERIRDFSRKRPAQRQPTDLLEVVDSSRRRLADVAADAPAVQLQCSARMPVTLSADRLQLEQLLFNLLKNAWDATAAVVGREAQIWVRIEDAPPGGVTVSVIDNGCGLPAETAARMFEPFFTTKVAGLGLGLALAKRVVEAHGGRLWAGPGAGACGLAVCFTLPREPQR